jgi:hypothetical protein
MTVPRMATTAPSGEVECTNAAAQKKEWNDKGTTHRVAAGGSL